jgi:Tol biopolymer transport system component
LSRRWLLLPTILVVLAVSGCAVGEPLTTTGITQTGATLRGNVYSSFEGTTEYWWIYGGTTEYGSETPHRTVEVSDESARPVSEPLTGLAPNTTYHFRLCARDEEESPPRTNCSKDGIFSTASAIGSSRIAFTRYVAEDSEIFTMSPNGAGAAPVTDNAWYESEPSWSPDVGQVAFRSEDGTSNWDIRKLDADGTDRVRLTLDPALDGQPAWSPDGARIAFVSQRAAPEHDEVYVMDSDGSDVVRLTSDSADSEEPAWSPDGTKIAFRRSGNIYAVGPGGGTPTAILSGFQAAEPAWSPDGTRIAFTSSVGTSTTDVFVMDSDGTDLTRLTSFTGFDRQPTWSPDGRKIAFSRRLGSGESTDEIFVMDADGSDPVRLTNNSLIDVEPDWSRVPPPVATVR